MLQRSLMDGDDDLYGVVEWCRVCAGRVYVAGRSAGKNQLAVGTFRILNALFTSTSLPVRNQQKKPR